MFTLNEAVKAGIVVEGEKLKKVKKHLKKHWPKYLGGAGLAAIGSTAGNVIDSDIRKPVAMGGVIATAPLAQQIGMKGGLALAKYLKKKKEKKK